MGELQPKTPFALNAYIGARVRTRRIMLGLSQQALGQKLGISFQQVQKYESGANRIAGGRFIELADVLKVPVSYFFADTTREGSDGGAENKPDHDDWIIGRQESIDLLRLYYSLPTIELRRHIRDLIMMIIAHSPTTSDAPRNGRRMRRHRGRDRIALPGDAP